MMKTYEWQEWPQVRVSNQFFNEMSDWVVQHKLEEVMVVAIKSINYFHVAIEDERLLTYSIVKWGGTVIPSELEQKAREKEEHDRVEEELKEAITKLNAALAKQELLSSEVKKRGLFSHSNGDWIHVKE
jgi:hypothetical protein